MKLFLLSIFAGATGTIAGVALLFMSSYAYYGGDVNAVDVLSFAPLMLAPALVMCGLLYAPGLLWLRRKRKNCAPAKLFVLFPALALNLPVFIVLLAGLFAGSVLFGTSEVLLFAVAFIIAGAVFGRGFVRYCNGKSVREKWAGRIGWDE